MPAGSATTIRHLAQVPEALSVLARWFVEEWEPYYGTEGPGDAEADLRAASSLDELPICLVALDDDGSPVGTIALRPESVPTHRHLGPWLAALLVAPEHRRRGIGSALITELEGEARRLGFRRIYTATDTATDMIENRGWQAIGEAPTLRDTVKLYMLDLRDVDDGSGGLED